MQPDHDTKSFNLDKEPVVFPDFEVRAMLPNISDITEIKILFSKPD